jgi:hypothetical protein
MVPHAGVLTQLITSLRAVLDWKPVLDTTHLPNHLSHSRLPGTPDSLNHLSRSLSPLHRHEWRQPLCC